MAVAPKLVKHTDGTGKGIGKEGAALFAGDPVEWIETHNQEYALSLNAQFDFVLEDKPIERIRAVYNGPLDFSTYVGLEKWPTIVWDVNGYYASLGVHWSASNKEIREAYQALQGYNSVRLTYIVKQLLNPKVRREYDATQPGSIFFDKYIAEYVKEQMLKDSIKETGRVPSFEDTVGEEVIDLDKYMDTAFDPDANDGYNDNRETRWRWGFYLWDTEVYNTEKLRQWQELLVRCLADMEAVVRIGIGLIGGSEESMVVEMVGNQIVVLLNVKETPTLQLASIAANRVVYTANK